MIGDKLILKEKHFIAAKDVISLILTDIQQSEECYTITVAGESGSGKTETATAIAEELQKMNISSVMLHQDDYFVLPPKSNDKHRRKNIAWVGTDEVNLELIDQHLLYAKQGGKSISKPLVIYDEDSIIIEKENLDGIKVIIAEGTYTTTLKHVDCRIFIDLSYLVTKKARLERAREEQDNFLEDVLKIENSIISKHKSKADIIITSTFNVSSNLDKPI